MSLCPGNRKRLFVDMQTVNCNGFYGGEVEALFLCLSNATLFAGTNITKPQGRQTHTLAIGPSDLNVAEGLGIH
jgi:hypothetical protein